MVAYQLKQAIIALAKTDDKPVKVVTLSAGSILRASGPVLPESKLIDINCDAGLIDIDCHGQTLSVYRRDLESRAEKLELAE